MWKGFKARLFKNDCQNRGYVLDGYPRNYKDCIKIFTRRKKTGEDDEEDQAESEDEAEDEGGDDEGGPEIKEPIPREIDELITPNHVIKLSATDQFLTERIKCISEEEVQAGVHYGEADMKRRCGRYRTQNEAPNGDPSTTDFFVEYKNEHIEVRDVEINDHDVKPECIGKGMKDFIHRNGRYFAYLTREEEEKQSLDVEVNK